LKINNLILEELVSLKQS